MNALQIKDTYTKRLERLKMDIQVYESSNIQELRIAVPSLKAEIETIEIILQAIEKQMPMKASFEYDDEFICPACGHEDDGYDVKRLKVCPECGQTLDWGV